MNANRRRKKREFRAAEGVTGDLRPGLVLNRHVGETINIGSEVVITLLSTKGPTAEIHVHAPGVSVDRGEVRQRKINDANGL